MRGRAMLGLGIVAAACGGGPRAEPRNAPASTQATQATRALLFRAAGFPTIDTAPLDDAVLDSAIAGIPVDQARSVADLGARLEKRDVRTLVLAHGSAFPVEAWPAIRSFLRGGGGLVVLGGAPFHEPVRADGATWIRGPRTT